MTDCDRCDGQGEVFDRKDFWGNDLTVQCPDCIWEAGAWAAIRQDWEREQAEWANRA